MSEKPKILKRTNEKIGITIIDKYEQSMQCLIPGCNGTIVEQPTTCGTIYICDVCAEYYKVCKDYS
jgi:hypothetical protein